MRTYELRHYVGVEKPAATRNDFEESGGWELHHHCWAEIKPLTEREQTHGGQQVAVASHRITIRWLPGVTTEMRIRCDRGTFEIGGIINLDERDEYLELSCQILS